MRQGVFISDVSNDERDEYIITFEDVREKVGNKIFMKDIHLSDFLRLVIREYLKRFNELTMNVLDELEMPRITLPTNKFNVIANISFVLRENSDVDDFLIERETLAMLLELLIDLSVDK